MGGHLAGCWFSTGKIGGKLQTPDAACSVSEGMVGQLGTSRGHQSCDVGGSTQQPGGVAVRAVAVSLPAQHY